LGKVLEDVSKSCLFASESTVPKNPKQLARTGSWFFSKFAADKRFNITIRDCLSVVGDLFTIYRVRDPAGILKRKSGKRDSSQNVSRQSNIECVPRSTDNMLHLRITGKCVLFKEILATARTAGENYEMVGKVIVLQESA
jgi:hypothetical protein